MTDEERQRTMDFIVEQQARFFAGMQKLEESQIRAENRMNGADGRIDRLERVAKLMIKAGLRARRQMREQNELFKERSADFERRFAALMEAQSHTDRRLDALIDIVRAQRNGSS